VPAGHISQEEVSSNDFFSPVCCISDLKNAGCQLGIGVNRVLIYANFSSSGLISVYDI
jgi:hypothetical protein